MDGSLPPSKASAGGSLHRAGRHAGRLLLLLGAALTLALAIGAPSVSAKTPNRSTKITATCSSVTYHFANWPNVPANTVTELIKERPSPKHVYIYKNPFTFAGPEGGNTVPISLSPGMHEIEVLVTWTNAAGGISESATYRFQLNCSPPPEPSFTIEKEQRLEGEGSYTKNQLTAKIGETVEYEIIVKNTGNVPLEFSPLSDAACEGISPSGGVTIPAGGEQDYTCTHKLTTTGTYINAASITGNEGTGPKASNEVEVVVEAPPTCARNEITSNFNGTEVASGEWVYFNSVIKVNKVTSAGGTIKFNHAHIMITLHSGDKIELAAPSATITYFDTEEHGQGSTEFNGTEWITRVPIYKGSPFNDNVFLTALAWKIPAGVQIAKAEPVSWEGDFTLGGSVTELQWQWAAAVYSTLPSYSELEVKPLHSTNEDKYPNGDQAGTPENPAVQKDHTEGARGGGGSNYTGSYSGTEKCL